MNVTQALEYEGDGWAVVPLGKDKKPLLPAGEHKEFLYRAANEVEVRAFWARFPDANVGLACGEVSGRTVVDIDEGEDVFPETLTVRTPSGGKHKIYRYSPLVKNAVGSYYPGIDIRNDGGYVVAAGSHCEYVKKGNSISGDYTIIEDIPSRPFPDALFTHKKSATGSFDPGKLMGAKEGSRNATAASVIGLLVSGKSKDIEVPLWELTKAWNSKCDPPLPEHELLVTFNSITAREWAKPKNDIKLIDGLKILQLGRKHVVEVPLPNGHVYFTFSEIARSRQSFETMLAIRLKLEKEGSLPVFEQRIDLNSASAIRNLATDLNSAYGNKKDGYNWVLILNRAGIAIKKHVEQEKKTLTFAPDSPYITHSYLVEHFLEEGTATLVHGDGSTGKSYLCLYMAACAALRRDFLGKKSTFFKTLYLDMESTSGKLSNRIHRIANTLQVPFSALSEHIHWYKPEGSLASEQELIAAFVQDTYGAIIVDAGAAATGGSPLDEQAVLRLFSALEQIPCAKLIIHHEPKTVLGGDDKAYYGTTFWRNAPRLAWRLKRLEKSPGRSIIQAIQHKANDDDESVPITYAMEFSPKDSLVPKVAFTVVDDFEATDDQKVMSFLVETGEATTGQIADAVGLPLTSTQRILQKLFDAEALDRKRDGEHVRRVLWYIPKKADF